ncbi:MAG: ATP-binding protein, partial [Thermoanaerobaculia bacterium]|nr:ATP-binding protein [Thermoanaerobaculia bacterium]
WGWLDAIHPDDRDDLSEKWQRALEREDESYDAEARLYCAADKTYRWFETRAIPLSDTEGVVREWVGVVHDIHREKEATRDLETVLGLERSARAEAEKANQIKDDFLSTVSHELRTPLTSLMGWAHMLRSGDLSEEETERAHEMIYSSAKTQAALIDEILEGSRMMRGTLDHEPSRVDIASIVRNSVDLVRPQARSAGIRIETKIDVEDTTIEADPRRIEQIMLNLLSNAIKFTESRGDRITVSLSRTDGEVRLRVKDRGIGISPEFLPHVFEKFRQQDQGSKRRHGGLGLGLALVKYLVEAHGGRIEAESEGVGKGATFTVYLPAREFSSTERKQLPKKKGRSREVDELAGLSVLLVEDDESARQLLEVLLRRHEMVVVVTGTAEEALEQLRKRPFDLLISDIGLPDRDGYDLIEELRRDGRRRNAKIPAIALSGYKPDHERLGDRRGFDLHVEKPIDPARFLSALVELAATRSS